jgi:hypothetical protein
MKLGTRSAPLALRLKSRTEIKAFSKHEVLQRLNSAVKLIQNYPGGSSETMYFIGLAVVRSETHCGIDLQNVWLSDTV